MIEQDSSDFDSNLFPCLKNSKKVDENTVK